jgi:hypothetical protein
VSRTWRFGSKKQDAIKSSSPENKNEGHVSSTPAGRPSTPLDGWPVAIDTSSEQVRVRLLCSGPSFPLCYCAKFCRGTWIMTATEEMDGEPDSRVEEDELNRRDRRRNCSHKARPEEDDETSSVKSTSSSSSIGSTESESTNCSTGSVDSLVLARQRWRRRRCVRQGERMRMMRRRKQEGENEAVAPRKAKQANVQTETCSR